MSSILEDLQSYKRETSILIGSLHSYVESSDPNMDHEQIKQILELAFNVGGVHARVTKLIEILQPKEEGSQ